MVTHVLIADDDERVRSLEAHILRRRGYCCTLASSVGEARDSLKQKDFDVALVDVKMLGESGLDLARTICGEHTNTATLMVTGEDDPKVADAMKKIGADLGVPWTT